jgi:hypothetical protein
LEGWTDAVPELACAPTEVAERDPDTPEPESWKVVPDTEEPPPGLVEPEERPAEPEGLSEDPALPLFPLDKVALCRDVCPPPEVAPLDTDELRLGLLFVTLSRRSAE